MHARQALWDSVVHKMSQVTHVYFIIQGLHGIFIWHQHGHSRDRERCEVPPVMVCKVTVVKLVSPLNFTLTVA